jgi:competence protein ComEC
LHRNAAVFRAGTLVAASVIAGAAVAVNSEVRPGDAAALSIAAASLALAARGRYRRGLSCLAFALAMCAWGAAARDRAVAPPLVTWFDRTSRGDGPVAIDGILAADATLAPAGVKLLIDVAAVREGGIWHPAAGRLQAHVSGDLASSRFAEWVRGRPVRAPVALRRPQVLLNFGGPSPARQAIRRPFALAGSIKSAALVEVERGAWWSETAAGLRRRVRDAAARFIAPQAPEAAAIVAAILIGDRAGLSDEVERRLQEAGTYHVIAISGGNVALLTALCFGLLRALFRSARIVAAGTLATIAMYGWVVGGDASVARAVAAAVVYLLLGFVGLHPRPLATLRVVAVVLLILDPLTVIDIGAWLSFAATLGIVAYGSGWTNRLFGPPRPGLIRAAVRWTGVLLVATVAAEAVLLPVTAAAFARVSVAGVLLNLAAIPAMAVVQVAGMLVVCGAAVSTQLATAAAAIASRAANLLLESCSLIDVLPWLSWRVPPTAPWWTVAYYGAVLWTTVVGTRRSRQCGLGVAAICLIVIVSAPGVSNARPAADRLRVTMVDVGQGESVLVQTPDGRTLLMDAGGTPGPFDIGGRVVTPALWALGVRQLDWLAMSHGDRDHVGGVPSVLRDLAPREIWEGVPVPRDQERRRLRVLSTELHVPWRTILAGARLELGEVVVEAVHPPAPEWERQKVRNDDSMVLRVSYGIVEIWLTGDAGEEFERSAASEVDRAPRLRILKVGHHGSRTATAARFVDVLRPQIALISAGRDNLFGHPAREVVSRLEAAGAKVFRTDQDGAIVVETDGVAARVSTAGGRTWCAAIAGVLRGSPP